MPAGSTVAIKLQHMVDDENQQSLIGPISLIRPIQDRPKEQLFLLNKQSKNCLNSPLRQPKTATLIEYCRPRH